MVKTLKVEYRRQFTYWEQEELLSVSVFPLIVIDGELLEDSFQIESFLDEHKLTFEEFTQLVPDGYDGSLEILTNKS